MNERLIRAYNCFFGWCFVLLGMCIGITLGLAMGGIFHAFPVILSLILFICLIFATFRDWKKEMDKIL